MSALALLGLLVLAGQENRLWQLELELRGACEAVRLDCGPDGETLLVGPFGPGEDRSLSVPVPVRAPLGREELALVPLPRAELLGAGPDASATVVAWSARQPVDELLAAGPRAGLSLPPAPRARPTAGLPELLAALLAGAFLLRLRARLLPTCLVAVASAALVLGLARARGEGADVVTLVQWREGSATALSIRRGEGELELGGPGLEVSPAGSPIRIEWEARGRGRARSAGGSLFALATTASPALRPERNGAERLEPVWTRTPEGRWRRHEAWELGAALGSGRDGSPPGWLAGALPPGRGILVARTSRGAWLRCLGFPVR
ncbi:MAG TPA: hypothetical protein VF530_23805 [Planctomycetota bacterium]